MSKQKQIIRDLKELKALHLASANVATRLITMLEDNTSSTRKGLTPALRKKIQEDFTNKLLNA